MSEPEKELHTLMQRVHTLKKKGEGEERAKRAAAKAEMVKKRAAAAAVFEEGKRAAKKSKYRKDDLKAQDRAKIRRRRPEE